MRTDHQLRETADVASPPPPPAHMRVGGAVAVPPMPPAPAHRPIPENPGKQRRWLTALGVMAAGVCLGGAAGAIIVLGDREDPASVEVKVQADESSAATPSIGNGGAGSSAVERGASNPPTERGVVYEPYVPGDSSYYYEAEMPSGAGWSRPEESFPTGGALLRTTVRGPEGAVVLIDRTPGEVPQLGGGYDSSRVVPQPEFGVATEYVFSTSEFIPECAGAPCVDYLIEDGNGGGWGVLAGGVSLAESKELASEVAGSIAN